jgi:hypothetical protein
MNNYQQKTPDPQGRSAVSKMGHNIGHLAPPSGSIGQALSARRHRFPTGRAQVMPPSPAPSMKKKNSHQQLPRRSLVNTQRRDEESRAEFFSSHVGRFINAHDLVANNNPSSQEGKEATRHSSRQQ